MSDENFSLFQRNIFSLLKQGKTDDSGNRIDPDTWFRTCIALEYNRVAKLYGSQCIISSSRAKDARQFWIKDLGRLEIAPRKNAGKTKNSDAEKATPDHFKQAGFLTYWMRRRIVSAKAEPLPQIGYDTQKANSQRNRFLLDHSEICSFMIGYWLCLFYENAPKLKGSDDISGDLHAFHLDRDYVLDMATLLKSKNVSPHALYLIYRSLFLSVSN